MTTPDCRTEYVPDVASEERRRLAECCAFFRAERYREAEPGKIRASDVTEAERQIAEAIEGASRVAPT